MDTWKLCFRLALQLAKDRSAVKTELETAEKQFIDLELEVAAARNTLADFLKSGPSVDLSVHQRTLVQLQSRFHYQRRIVNEAASRICLRVVEQVGASLFNRQKYSAEELCRIHSVLKQFLQVAREMPAQIINAVRTVISHIDQRDFN